MAGLAMAVALLGPKCWTLVVMAWECGKQLAPTG